MSRQVLAAVFPLLKAQWALTDSQLGTLGGVVALMVGLLTFPLSLLADRVGRARSVAAMALTWSVATLACGLAASYGQLLFARLVLGVGEAAYGSVGLAVVFTYFPRTMRATITSSAFHGRRGFRLVHRPRVGQRRLGADGLARVLQRHGRHRSCCWPSAYVLPSCATGPARRAATEPAARYSPVGLRVLARGLFGDRARSSSTIHGQRTAALRAGLADHRLGRPAI